MKLLWRIMERLRGAVCEYHDSKISLDSRVAFLPQVRAAFLREWPGSPNIHTRKATYSRVFKSIAHAGGFNRLRVVPLRSYQVGDSHRLLILHSFGRDILYPVEALSPFVELKAAPVMEAVQPKTTAQREPDREPTLVEAASFLSSPMSCWGEDSGPVVPLTGPRTPNGGG